jgi:hypothetical protein
VQQYAALTPLKGRHPGGEQLAGGQLAVLCQAGFEVTFGVLEARLGRDCNETRLGAGFVGVCTRNRVEFEVSCVLTTVLTIGTIGMHLLRQLTGSSMLRCCFVPHAHAAQHRELCNKLIYLHNEQHLPHP